MVICCVVNCSSRSGRDGVAFYSIPSEKKDPARRKAFIWAAGRVATATRSKPWTPSDSTRICSKHFIGGHKSEDPKSESYVPTENLPVSPAGAKGFWKSAPKRRINRRQLSVITTPGDLTAETANSDDERGDTGMEQEDVQQSTRSKDNWFMFLWACMVALFLLVVGKVLDHRHMVTLGKTADEEGPGRAEHSYSRKSSERQIADLEREKAYLQQRLLVLDNIKSDDKIFRFYTGFPNYGTFNSLFNYLQPKARRMRYVNSSYENECIRPPKRFSKERKLDLEHEFLMTLIRLKQGMFEVDLARNFGLSQGYCSKIISTWLDFLYCELKSLCLFPSASKVRCTAPESFRNYKDTRIILDCTEEFIERPSNINAAKSTYSHYKSHHTMKFLIGIAPNGFVSFISPAWGGRASDKLITQESELYSWLDKGDSVMVDRGFDIQAELKDRGVTLNILAFKGLRDQLDASEVHSSLRIAQVRIHVERLIGRIKTFHILDRELRLSMHDRLEQIFVICAYLTNFQSPIIKPEE